MRAFEICDKTQLSVMEVNGPDISKYGVVVPNGEPGSVAGLVEKPDADKAPSSLAIWLMLILRLNNSNSYLSRSATSGACTNATWARCGRQRKKALRAWCAFNRDENRNSRNELKLQLKGE